MLKVSKAKHINKIKWNICDINNEISRLFDFGYWSYVGEDSFKTFLRPFQHKEVWTNYPVACFDGAYTYRVCGSGAFLVLSTQGSMD